MAATVPFNGLTNFKTGMTVQQIYNTFTQTNSTSYSDSGLTLAITPQTTSSKVLVTAMIQVDTNGDNSVHFKIIRGSTEVEEFEMQLRSGSQIGAATALSFLDSPSTTSATTYKLTWRAQSASYVRINSYASDAGDCSSSLTLTEIV
tara:strand:- start:262 stop:702 length:441 start_codon:yes stop_codon:yes gene_type:complete